MGKEAILIHGWNPDVYNNNLHHPFSESVAWSNRRRLVDLLTNTYDLRFYNLPGFCGVKEPKKPYDIEDFSNNFDKWLDIQPKTPNLIVGYSFGGVVALEHKIRFRSSIPLVLIAPALSRQESFRSDMARFFGSFPVISGNQKIKDIYQTIFSGYYRRGTPFIRESYDRIARRDTRHLLELVNPSELLLIYGSTDNSTPWNRVKRIIKERGLNYLLISGGGHDIGETHPGRIAQQIEKFEGE